MPTALPASSSAALRRSLAKHADFIGDDMVQKVTDKLLDGIRSILNPGEDERGVTVGESPMTVRAGLGDLLKDFEEGGIAEKLNLDFAIDTAVKVAGHAGQYVQQNDPDVVDAYPALELTRFYERDVPRGYRRTKTGLVAVPQEDWPTRWQAAAATSGDADAARILHSTGRMIALKESSIWAALGSGEGGYSDTLGNPFPPFAFNSGFDTEDISRAECEEIGLLDPGEQAKPAPYDLANLIYTPEVAA